MYKQKYKEGQQIHKDIYLYICRYIKEHRYAPSYKEIADGAKTPRAFRLTGYEFVTRRNKHETV